MKSTIINSSSYKDSFALVKQIIDSRVVDLDKKYYIIVPDDCTIMTERLLFSRSGAFDVEVLTFNRLFNKYVNVKDYLPRVGAVMLLKSVIKPLEKSLKFFRRSIEKKGFCEKLYETIKTLVSCNISPSDLSLCEGAVAKIEDIRLMYEAYLSASKDRFIDANGRMQLLKLQLAKMELSSINFIIAGFGEFSVQQAEIIEILKSRALSVRLFEVGSPLQKLGEVEFYCSPDDADQLKMAAKRIRQYAKNGARYSEMAIISPSIAFERAKRILSEFDIPFTIDNKTVLGEESLARFFFLLQRAVEHGYKTADIIALAKNPFCGIDKTQSDIFENYCIKFGIEYKSFFSELVPMDKELLPLAAMQERSCAEQVRVKLLSIINRFLSYRCVKNAEQFYVFTQRVIDMAKGCASVEGADTQAEKILSCAQVLIKISGSQMQSFGEMFDIFSEGLLANSYSVLPKYSDAVTIGDCSSFRAHNVRHIFVIDFCEGVVPPHKEDCELITDQEIDILDTFNINSIPKVSSKNQSLMNDFLFSTTQTSSVFLAYSESGNKRKSELYPFFLAADKKRFWDFESEYKLFFSNKSEDDEQIAAACSTKSNAIETLIISSSRVLKGEAGLPICAELGSIFDKEEYEKYIGFSLGTHRLQGGIRLSSKGASISLMQDYFSCPYYAFLKRIINISPRKQYKLSIKDAGIFLHKAAKKFIDKNEFSSPSDSMKSVCEQIVVEDEKYLLDGNKALTMRLVDEACRIAPILARQIQGGLFKKLYTEKQFSFDGKDDLRTVELRCKNGDVPLVGTIDRVDNFGRFIRIIDYKSGGSIKKDFDFCDLYYGKKLQLFIYMLVMRQNKLEGKNKECYLPIGGFYFPFVSSWDDTDFSHRLRGIYEGEPFILTSIDTQLEEAGYHSDIFNCKRKVKPKLSKKMEAALLLNPKPLGVEDFCKCNYAFTSEQIDLFCRYAQSVMTRAVDEFIDGNIMPSPTGSACKYCSYSSVCGMRCTVKTREHKNVGADAIIALMQRRAHDEKQ